MNLHFEHWKFMQQKVAESYPLEACGLVAGIHAVSCAVYPVTNELRSPVRYRFDPQEQVEAFMDIEAHGWELLAIYHSHPNGPELPSQTDVEEFAYPGVLSLIWFIGRSGWQCRSFLIAKSQIIESPLKIIAEK
jgi:proteasome lid subunit RPN8/RPN11